MKNSSLLSSLHRSGLTTLAACGLGGLFLGLAPIVACGASDTAPIGAVPTPDSSTDAPPPDPTAPVPSGFGTSDSGPPDAAPEACVSKEAEAVLGKRPVDIIFIIDNSDSMAAEIDQVEEQINTNFAGIIEASGVDYRVIMLSRHGAHTEPVNPNDPLQRICVKAPLSATTCDPIPAAPAETTKFVHHNIVVNSQDAWCKILDTFNGPDETGAHPQGWSAFLRPLAFKVFAVITDDRMLATCGNGTSYNDKFDDVQSGTNEANKFDSQLRSLSSLHFGTLAKRNYIWHSIIGLSPFNPSNLALPHSPSEPVVTTCCGGECGTAAVAPGTGYQALSKLTGGLRYPTCNPDYTAIFQAMAQGVVDQAVVACDYEMPANPAGGTIDPATAIVRYTSGTTVTDFKQVANAAECAPGKFYIEGTRIKLCSDACLTVQGDPNAQIKVLFGCLPKDTTQ
jgi:hypothetical protein